MNPPLDEFGGLDYQERDAAGDQADGAIEQTQGVNLKQCLHRRNMVNGNLDNHGSRDNA